MKFLLVLGYFSNTYQVLSISDKPTERKARELRGKVFSFSILLLLGRSDPIPFSLPPFFLPFLVVICVGKLSLAFSLLFGRL